MDIKTTIQIFIKKVTSGSKGYASSVFTTLGMYWQLHLAYDDAWIRPDDTNMFTSRMYQAYRHADRTNVDYQKSLDSYGFFGS